MTEYLENGARVDWRDNYGLTALIWASILGYSEVVEALLKAGADVNLHSNLGLTAFMFACLMGLLGIVELFLNSDDSNFNYNAHIKDLQFGMTAFHWACGEKGRSEIVSMLLDEFPNLNISGFAHGRDSFDAIS